MEKKIRQLNKDQISYGREMNQKFFWYGAITFLVIVLFSLVVFAMFAKVPLYHELNTDPLPRGIYFTIGENHATIELDGTRDQEFIRLAQTYFTKQSHLDFNTRVCR
jgi:uncharacterized membrane protein (DUF485 family)